ncbi:MAG: 4-hydroxythreonine-4-phosphate dehydrogenase PdxA [Pyrinomonadaceae bacterium]
MRNLPKIGITLGDPAGIGPEIVAKALKDPKIFSVCRPIVIGRRRDLESINVSETVKDDSFEIIEPADDSFKVETGKESAETGLIAARSIEKSWELLKDGIIDAVATAPISKNALKLAGYNYPGHTEFYASLSSTKRFAMSFFAGNLRVVLLSTHLPLKSALNLVRCDRIAEIISFTDTELGNLLGRRPRIAVAGLNPHASEGGIFGEEEIKEIFPAIKECKSKSINVLGPFSPDTIFLRCQKGEFDAVIALYHDQATIAVKSLSFGNAVNVTLGLPFIRTSVDHGTAFDIAGKGIADESSMRAAILLAAELIAGNSVKES